MSRVGAVVGGLVALRYRPRRPLVACVLWPTLYTLQLIALALGAPTWMIASAAFFGGFGIAIHLTLCMLLIPSVWKIGRARTATTIA